MLSKATSTLALALAALGVLSAPAEAGVPRTLSISDAKRAEPLGNTRVPMNFKVTLSAENPTRSVSVDYATSPGTAGPLDYQPGFGTVTIPAGRTRAVISIPVRGDLFAEPAETFRVELERARRASIDDGEAEGLIPANDNGPDADGDDIPDADDCAPSDPNPEGQVECFVPTTIYDLNDGDLALGTRAYIENVLITARADDGRIAYGAIVPGDAGYVGQDFSAIELRSSGEFLGPETRYLLLGTVRAGYFQVTFADQSNCCEPVPAPISVTPAQLAAGPNGLNGLLVEIANVEIASSTGTEWLLEEDVRVDNELFAGLPDFGPGTTFESIRGHASTLGGATPSLSPRFLEDLDPTAALLIAFNQFDSCLDTGEQDVTIGEVVIDEPQGTDTVVNIDPVKPGLLSTPATVTITAGNTTAPVIADALDEEDFTEVIASIGPVEQSIFVDVAEGC